MSGSPSFAELLIVMAVVAFACRAGGFFVMRFLPPSERLDAALRGTPLAVMGGIVALTLVRGGVSELIATAAVVAAMFVTRNEVLSALVGVGVIAALRAYAG
jgi:uncharacterized membrane protein